jgi:hypothetical protein
MEKTKYILDGGVDLHTHAGPDFYPRSVDEFELAENAKSEKMAAVVIKNHFCPTYFAANAVAQKITDIKIFGGLVLNNYVGGMNVYAVDLAVKAGAKIIWMPTLSEANHLAYYGASDFNMQSHKIPLRSQDSGLTICENGVLKPEVYEILEVIAPSDTILATGHVSSEEALLLVKEASTMGVEKILVNHPDDRVCGFPKEGQLEMIAHGAILEQALITTMPGWGEMSIKDIAARIHSLGAEHCVLVTDFGQTHHETPTDGLKKFVRELLVNGISQEEIHVMLCMNPCSLLGIT